MASNRQSKHMYPSFMLHDLKANELNLSQSQIENLIKNSPILTQNIYRLYYEDGYSQAYICNELNITNVALEALENVDLIMFMLDGTQEISTGDIFVNEHIKEVTTPVVLIINKIDKMSDEEIEAKKEEIKEKLGDFDNIITLTAEFAIGIHKIFEVAEKYLSNDVWFYPEDYYTDLPVNKIVVETVREKILHHTKDEVPHSVAVEIVNVETKPEIRKYDVNIYVERDSQKGIIIGKDGALLKKIGIEARREIEALIDLKVNLKLWVKVRKKWRRDQQFLNDMGYKIKKKVKK